MNPAQTIAQQFLQQYYQTLMTNKMGLIQFYTDASHMTYGGQQHDGIKQINEKLESLAFQKIVYKIDDMDVQPGALENSLFIFVTGQLQMDDAETYKFSQSFQILPNGQGGLYVHNDIVNLKFKILSLIISSDQFIDIYQQQKLLKMGFEDQIPPIPNRDQEKRYIATVEKSFYDQPLYKFYMNEALRERKMDYADKLNTFKYEWILNFAASGIVFSLLYFIPVSYFYRQTTTGVPTYYQPKNKAVFKQGYLQNQNWKRFKLYSFLVVGSAFIFAHTYTDRSQIHDEYYNNVGVIKPKFE